MSRRKISVVDEILALPHTKLIDGKVYVRIVFKDATGKQKEKHRQVGSVNEAISAIEQIRQEIGERGPGAFDGERMTFNELMDEYKKVKVIPRWYADPLIAFFGQRRIKTITYGDIQQFKISREQEPKKGTETEKRSPATINRELEWLRTILLYAIRHEWLTRNPFNKGAIPLIRKSEEQPRVRIPTPEEEAKILAWCIDEREHLRAILIAAKDTGLRKSKLLGLVWWNIEFKVEDDKTVVGYFLKVPQGNRYKKAPKVIALTDRLRAELQALWEKPKEKPKTLDMKIFGGIKDIKRSYATACRKAGVTDLHFHDWRHGYATDMVEAGVEERLAMIALGHTNAETHAIYTNVDERLAREIAIRLNDLHQRRQKNVVENPDPENNFIN